MAKKNISTDTSDYLTSADIKAAVEFLEKNQIANKWAATAVPPPPKNVVNLTSADMEELTKLWKEQEDIWLNGTESPPKGSKPRKDDVHQFDHLLPDEFNEPEKPPMNKITYKSSDWFKIDPMPKLAEDILEDVAKKLDDTILESLKGWEDEHGKWEVIVYPQSGLDFPTTISLKLYSSNSVDIIGACQHINPVLKINSLIINSIINVLKMDILKKL